MGWGLPVFQHSLRGGHGCLLSPPTKPFLPQWLRTRPPLTPALPGQHVQQRGRRGVRPSYKAGNNWWGPDSSAQCHCIHLPTSMPIQGGECQWGGGQHLSAGSTGRCSKTGKEPRAPTRLTAGWLAGFLSQTAPGAEAPQANPGMSSPQRPTSVSHIAEAPSLLRVTLPSQGNFLSKEGERSRAVRGGQVVAVPGGHSLV